MITITEQSIEHIPALFVTKKNEQTKRLPTVVYFHGFTSAKEHNLPLAYLLAKKNYRVILPDSKWHGAREGNISETKKQLSFWDIVLKNIEEAEMIKQFLEKEQLMTDGRFGVAGTSMGGITTAALLATYDWINVAAILMGSPKMISFANWLLDQFPDKSKLPSEAEINQLIQTLTRYDLSDQLHKLNDRPLLLWHGEADRVVPFDHTASFYELAKHEYSNKDHLHFIKEPNRDHKVSRHAILKTVDWFTTYL